MRNFSPSVQFYSLLSFLFKNKFLQEVLDPRCFKFIFSLFFDNLRMHGGMENMRKRTTELLGDVRVLLTFTGEIENYTKLASGNKFNNGNQKFYINSNKSTRKLTRL